MTHSAGEPRAFLWLYTLDLGNCTLKMLTSQGEGVAMYLDLHKLSTKRTSIAVEMREVCMNWALD